MRVEDLPVEKLEEMVEDLADIRHDLGKYLTLGARFLGPEPGLADLREALKGDLLRTARRTSGDETAWELWRRLRPEGLETDPDIQRIDEGIQALATADLEGDRPVLEAAAACAVEVAQATRSLHHRAAVRLAESAPNEGAEHG